MDCPFENICVKCDKGENLLLCNENGCPMAIHERCMGCPARFDDVGNFYCPYCLYKKAVSELRQAEEIAKSKRKDFFIFIHGERKGVEEHLREKNRGKAKLPNQFEVNEADVSMLTGSQGKRRRKRRLILTPDELDEEHDTRGAEKVNIHEKNSEKGSGSGYLDLSIVIHKDHCINTSDEKKIQEEDKINNDDDEEEEVEEETSDSSGQDPLLNKNEESKINAAEKEKNVGENLETSDSSSDQEGSSRKMHKKQKINNAGRKKIQEVGNNISASCDNNALPNVNVKGKRTINRSDSIDSDDMVDSMPIKHKKTQKSTTTCTPRVLSPNYATSERRKRLRWSWEEEEALKVGVQKFSNPEQKQNIPWRKILDFGRHVFHETRSPVDLKDKWRKIVG